ncbi:5'-3' exoribonuclease 2 [Smittium culicis]|uniref:5'-3' exoribonuclease 2 n=1 Tax=Smittium culicis TaxID=133412 RepID=A0A1R1XFI9_9FUNG|nr:5'-3' exoribonuclease 2 [Smittium culicis]
MWRDCAGYSTTTTKAALRGHASLDIKFDLGFPIKPLEQLMSVLPAASKSNVPKPFAQLMVDESSPIIQFYPETFKIDLNGKKQSWQGVCLLPFIDGDLLLNSLQDVYGCLTENEVTRNTLGYPIICVSSANPIYEQLCQLYGKNSTNSMNIKYDDLSCITGVAKKDSNFVPHTTYISPFNRSSKPNIDHDSSIRVRFDLDPVEEISPSSSDAPDEQDLKDDGSKKAKKKSKKSRNNYYPCQLLKGVVLPAPTLTSADREFVLTGGRSGYRGNPRGNRFGNNRDFSHFYKQQGSDVYYDRGYSNNSNNGSSNQYVRYNSYGNNRGSNTRGDYSSGRNFNSGGNYNTGGNYSSGNNYHSSSSGYQHRPNQYRGNSNNRNEPYPGNFPGQRFQNNEYSNNSNDYRNNNNNYQNRNSNYNTRGQNTPYRGNNNSYQNNNRPNYRPRTSFIPKPDQK